MLLGLPAFVFALASSTVSGELSCFYNYTLYSNNCYRFYSSPLSNYNDALKICRNDGADLVSIHNAFENQYVWSIGSGGILIGLRYDANKDLYQWSDNSSVDYVNGDSTFISHRDYLGYCAQNVHGKWTNAECEDDKLVFVCKAKAVDVPDTPTWGCPDPDTIYDVPGTLFSPGYPAEYNLMPDAYPDGCYYKLAAKNGYKVRIHIQEINLKNNIGNIIVYKRLTTTTGNEVARIDERFIGGELLMESNVALLHLNGSYSGKWKITWNGEVPSATTAEDVCPSWNIIYTESETIYSPGYPENFEFTLETMSVGCCYKLIAEKGHYIEIRMDEISLDLDEAEVNIYRTWAEEAADHVLSFKNRNLEQTIKVDSDKALIRVWNSHRGLYKIAWRSFQSESCRNAWIYFNGSCYMQDKSAVPFDEANAFCLRQFSHPVYIETVEEQQFLAGSLLLQEPLFWLGLTETTNGGYAWLNNQALTYSNWCPDDPNHCCGLGPPYCGLIEGTHNLLGCWEDFACSFDASTLCEYEAKVLS